MDGTSERSASFAHAVTSLFPHGMLLGERNSRQVREAWE